MNTFLYIILFGKFYFGNIYKLCVFFFVVLVKEMGSFELGYNNTRSNDPRNENLSRRAPRRTHKYILI